MGSRPALGRGLEELLEPPTSVGQEGDRPLHVARGAREIVSPYLTSKEALVYLRLGSLSALYTHIRENGLPTCRCGGNLRFDTRELDAWMRGLDSLEWARAKRRGGVRSVKRSA